jgi:hypothetical protein
MGRKTILIAVSFSTGVSLLSALFFPGNRTRTFGADQLFNWNSENSPSAKIESLVKQEE